MAKKTPFDKLQESLDKILRDYEEEVVKDTGELAKKFGQKGAQAVRASAQQHGWGRHTGYDKGWTTTFEQTRYGQKAVIHNKTVPGLAHLLENGHALRNGGRSRAFPHIAPVEQTITEEFYKAVKNSI